MNSFGNIMVFNTPKAESLGYITSPIEKEKIKAVVLSILNVLGTMQNLLLCK